MFANFVAAIFLLAGSSIVAEDAADSVTFQLFTRSSAKTPRELDHNLSGMEASKPTVLFIHGFGGSSKAKSALIIKDAVLSAWDWNVVLADWGQLAGGDSYEVAVKNTLVAGEAVGRFVRKLVQLPGSDRRNLTVLGFSLGAHVAGIAANHLGSARLAKIIALDAAGPMYNGKKLTERLDAGDADFVMAIHTCEDFFGINVTIGHADFYPNGGRSPQPACVHDEVKQVCSHFMAPILFAESVYNPTAFLATDCSSWSDYSSKKCEQKEKVFMGLDTPSTARGKYFLTTKAHAPYGDTSSAKHVVKTAPQDIMDDATPLDEQYDVEETTAKQEAEDSSKSSAGGTYAGVVLVLSAAASALAR